MTNDLLEMFYKDEHTREAVKQFQVSLLEKMAIENVFQEGGKDGEAIRQAKDLVEHSFKTLSDLYAPKENPSSPSSR